MKRVIGGVLLLVVGTVGAAGAAADEAVATARAGGIVAIPLGRQDGLARHQVTVVVTTASGDSIVYAPGDDRIRAVVNVYPDPMSRLRVGDPDRATPAAWWETFAYLDIPETAAPGEATVAVYGPHGALTPAAVIEVLPPTGQTPAAAPRLDELRLLERADHMTVAFRGPTAPHALQVELGYTAGESRPRVVNPHADVTVLSWADDGRTLRVLLSPAVGGAPTDLEQFTFHVTGAALEAAPASVRAYDAAGRPVAGVVVDIR